MISSTEMIKNIFIHINNQLTPDQLLTSHEDTKKDSNIIISVYSFLKFQISEIESSKVQLGAQSCKIKGHIGDSMLKRRDRRYELMAKSVAMIEVIIEVMKQKDKK